MLKNLKKKKKGFTLIELIIVIAIIAILAAVALPKFGEVRQNANIKTDIANAKTIAGAATTLYTEEKLTAGTYTVGSNDTLDDYLQSEPKGKTGNYKGKPFVVTIGADGAVKVYLKGHTTAQNVLVYPSGEGVYNIN